MRKLFLVACLAATGCAQLDTVGGTVTATQAQYLMSLEARDKRQSEDMRQVLKTIESVAASGDSTSRVVGLLMLDRISNGVAQARAAQVALPPQEGPITNFMKAALPFVLPLAQIWATDRAGERSLDQAYANMNLIGTIAGQIQRDPLVVTSPAPQIVNPVVINPQPPVIVDRPPPIIIDQPILVPVQ